jgi:hypothetical protein
VDGGVRLDQAALRVTVAAGTTTGGGPLTIVDNTGDPAVAGTFRGLPEGATVSARTAVGPAARFRIGYRGGDGNDVVLEPLPAADPAAGPKRHDQRSFTVTVGEVNRPPALRGPARASVAEGKPLRLAFSASDPDRPGGRLEYGLTGDAPTGARIDPRTGVLRWTPGGGQGPGEYTVVVWVLDGGTPRLADTMTVTITVTPRPPVATSGTAAKPSRPAAPPPPPAGGCHARHG